MPAGVRKGILSHISVKPTKTLRNVYSNSSMHLLTILHHPLSWNLTSTLTLMRLDSLTYFGKHFWFDHLELEESAVDQLKLLL